MTFVFIAALLLFIVMIILILPISIRFSFDNTEFLSVLKIGFIKINLNKEKKNKKTEKNNSGVLSKLKELKELDKKDKNGSFLSTAKKLFDLFAYIFEILSRILPKCVLKRFHLNLTLGNEDAGLAAMEYGGVCSIIYPLSGYIQSVIKVKEDAVKINLDCKYQDIKTNLTLDMIVSVRVFNIIGIIINMIKENVK